jgi:hypothetical protein
MPRHVVEEPFAYRQAEFVTGNHDPLFPYRATLARAAAGIRAAELFP